MIRTLSKTLERMIHTQIRDEIDQNLSVTQFGSRENRSCADMMRVINRWIEETKEKEMEYTIIQADIEGGFDKIEPRRVIERIPGEYKSWVQSWCTERKAKFRFNGKTSRTFDITAGVPQGSPLSPYLFAIAMQTIAEPKKQDQKRQKALNLS